MSPEGPNRGGNVAASNNVYTAILALAFLAVFATAALVAYKCYTQYGTFFKIP